MRVGTHILHEDPCADAHKHTADRDFEKRVPLHVHVHAHPDLHFYS